MNEMTFKTGIGFLTEMYGKTVTDEVYKNYWNILKGYSDEAFKTMLENIVKTFVPTSQVPFPLIPHFLNAGGFSGKQRAKLAIKALCEAAGRIGSYRSISFGDRALHATIERFGGWNDVSHWSQEDWNFREKSFIEMYEANLIDGSGPDYLPGLSEIHNDTIALSGKQLELPNKLNKIVEYQWHGYVPMIDYKAKRQIAKQSGGMQSIAGIIGV